MCKVCDMGRDGIDTKRMVALTSVSEAAGLAVAYAEDDHAQPAAKRGAALPKVRNAADMTWAEPKFRTGFETPRQDSPRYVLTSTLAQWLTSRSRFKAS